MPRGKAEYKEMEDFRTGAKIEDMSKSPGNMESHKPKVDTKVEEEVELAGKGWEEYNNLCDEGIVAKDYDLTRDTVGEVIGRMEDEIETKAPIAGLERAVEGAYRSGKQRLMAGAKKKKGDILRQKMRHITHPENTLKDFDSVFLKKKKK